MIFALCVRPPEYTTCTSKAPLKAFLKIVTEGGIAAEVDSIKTLPFPLLHSLRASRWTAFTEEYTP